jgi:hypothetical protein
MKEISYVHTGYRYPNLSYILGLLNFPNMSVGVLVMLICCLTLSCIVPVFPIKRLLFSFYQHNCSYLIVSSVTEVNKIFLVRCFMTYVWNAFHLDDIQVDLAEPSCWQGKNGNVTGDKWVHNIQINIPGLERDGSYIPCGFIYNNSHCCSKTPAKYWLCSHVAEVVGASPEPKRTRDWRCFQVNSFLCFPGLV